MKLDFLEIGTSDFETIIQSCDDLSVGIIVEPVLCYLEKLPNKPNVKKIHAAISMSETCGSCDVYYIHPDEIIKRSLPNWIRGCNKINDYHPQHEWLKLKEIVIKDTVREIPISKILKDNNVTEISVMKIDTEGADCKILFNFFEQVKICNINSSCLPSKIIFENNRLTDSVELAMVIGISQKIGYTVGGQDGDELTLIRTELASHDAT